VGAALRDPDLETVGNRTWASHGFYGLYVAGHGTLEHNA